MASLPARPQNQNLRGVVLLSSGRKLGGPRRRVAYKSAILAGAARGRKGRPVSHDLRAADGTNPRLRCWRDRRDKQTPKRHHCARIACTTTGGCRGFPATPFATSRSVVLADHAPTSFKGERACYPRPHSRRQDQRSTAPSASRYADRVCGAPSMRTIVRYVKSYARHRTVDTAKARAVLLPDVRCALYPGTR
jgi:hypothetical protein